MTAQQLRPRSTNISYLEILPEASASALPQPRQRKTSVKTRPQRIMKNHSPPPGKAKSALSHSIILPEVPLYCPLRHPYPLHSPINHLPSSLLALNSIKPSDIVNLFLTEELFQTMSSNTNLYAQQKRSETLPSTGGRDWHDVTPRELRIWIGILIYMGLFSGKSAAAREFWLHAQHHPTHHINKFMSQTRFEQIKRYFHLSNPEEDQAESSTGHRLWH